jgi:hypothetical protein
MGSVHGFSFLVLLILLKSKLIFPSNIRAAFDTVNIDHRMHSRHHHPIFFLASIHIHYLTEEVSFPMSGLKRLRDDIITESKIGLAVLTTVRLAFQIHQEQSPHL